MAAPLDLALAKKNLQDALGDGMKLYLQILRQWFKTKLSREDFDHEARKLMTPDTVHLHNQFLLCIIVKCDKLGSSLGSSHRSMGTDQHKRSLVKSQKGKDSKAHSSQKAKRYKNNRRRLHHYSNTSSKTSFSQRFVAADPLVMAPQIQLHYSEPEERGPGYVCREQVLPDLGMLQGRLLVAAWDHGLDDVQDDVARVLLVAVEHHLKSVLTAIVSRRHGYKVRDGRFRHGVGTQVAPPHVRNTLLAQGNSSAHCSEATSVTSSGVHMASMRPSLATADRDAALNLSLAQPEYVPHGPISMFDCLEALQNNKSAIPSHSVWSQCVERIVHRLWHPSREEMEAHHTVRSKTTTTATTAADQGTGGWRMGTSKS